MKLSVVIPIYNEEKTLREIVGRVMATPYDKEILLVNDCSKDSTAEIMAELLAEHPDVIRCFHHEKNLGKGGGLATGFAQTRGDVVLIQDADLEYDPSDYPALTMVSNMFTNLNLTDMETCYKVFRKEFADRLDLQSRTFAVEPEITAKVAKMRARIFEVPISYAGRDYSEGKKIGPKDAVIAIWAIMRWSLFGKVKPAQR